MACSGMRAIPRAAPALCAGLVRPPFAAPHGPRSKRASKALDPGFRRETTKVRFASAWLLRPGLPRSALPGFPLGRGEGAEEKARRGARTDARAFAVRPGMCLSANLRSALAQSPGRMPGDRGREGALLFGYFLLGKQEKVTRSPGMARETTQGRESVFATAPKVKSKSKDAGFPGLRRDDEMKEVAHTERTPSPPNPPLEGEG